MKKRPHFVGKVNPRVDYIPELQCCYPGGKKERENLNVKKMFYVFSSL